ncbi:hypothetical protein JF50_15845 [Pseudoalteromonas luteoviolacea]|uniref:PKD domain-containing protein n=1 Tax=Pseudoalteromonas luteoviolacea TaxID=43657 RepID=A0A0C1MG42_9GAMM|nr:hypothetical protein [Pseudoalteromonas luteoviolacea]KID55824.1 hypothetical protein JF50_15845 [Pseudoalteromonas luteoviolacea]
MVEQVNVIKRLFLTIVMLGLVACGGSDNHNDSSGDEGRDAPTTNLPPTVSIEGASEVYSQESITLNGIAIDTDGSIESYHWSVDKSLPLTLSGEYTPNLTIVSGPLDADMTVNVSLQVEDNLGKKTSATTQLVIKVKPFPISISGVESVSEQTTFSLSLSGLSDDDDITSITWSTDSSLALELVGTNDSSLVVKTPDIDRDETLHFTAKVDYKGQIYTLTHAVIVRALQAQVPSITINGVTTAQEQTTFTLSVADYNNLHNVFSVKWAHDSDIGIVLNGVTDSELNVSVPDLVNDGSVTFTVNIEFNDGTTVSAAHKITLVAKANLPPTVAIMGSKQAEERTTIVLQADAKDLDGQIVSYAWTHNAGFDIAIAGETSAQLVVDIGNVAAVQTVNFAVSVIDNQGAASRASIDITVLPIPNILPTAEIVGPAKFLEQSSVTLTAQASDLDGTIEAFIWSYDSDVVLVASGADESYTLESLDITQNHQVTVFLTVKDNEGGSYTTQRVIELEALENTIPSVQVQAPRKAIEKLQFSLQGLATDDDGEIITHLWTHNSPIELTIQGQNTDSISVLSPDLAEPLDVVFTYTVTDNQGAQANASAMVTIENIEQELVIAGKVTDGPIANANVSMQIGESWYHTKADANGDYILPVDVLDITEAQLVKLYASGVGSQSSVSLVSQLGSIGSLVNAAGDDKVLTADELFDINVTNMTTAEYAVLAKVTPTYTNDQELLEARSQISFQSQLMLSTLLKAVIDYDFELPDGVSSTLELALNSDVAEEQLALIQQNQPALLEQITQEILNDSDVIHNDEFVDDGEYIVFDNHNIDELGFRLTFLSGSNRGSISNHLSNSLFDYTKEGNKIRIELEEGFYVLSNKLKYESGFFVSGLTITTHEYNGWSYNARIEFDLITGLEEIPSGKYSTAVQMQSGKNLIELTKEDILGTWSLSLETGVPYATKYKFMTGSRLLALKGSEVIDDSDWTYNDGRIGLHSNDYILRVLSKFNFGYRVAVYSRLGEYYQDAFMIKHQDTDFNEINYQKKWERQHSKYHNYELKVDENSFDFSWFAGARVINEEGTLRRFDYLLNGESVNYCNTELTGCTINKRYDIELVSQIDDVIAVSITSGQSSFFGLVENHIHFYKLKDEALNVDRFDASFFEQNQLTEIFNIHSVMYSRSGGNVTKLYGELSCPPRQDPDYNCSNTLSFLGEKYQASIENDVLKLTHDVTGGVTYLGISGNSNDGLVLCHFEENSTCDAGTKLDFKFEKPRLDININTLGDGKVTTSADTFYYGESFNVHIEELVEGSFNGVSGCDGWLSDQVTEEILYVVTKPTESCDITVNFTPDAPPFFEHKAFTLIEISSNELMNSWQFELETDHDGTFYGLDANTTFSKHNLSPTEYEFQLASRVKVRVHGDVFYTERFKLNSDPNEKTLCFYGANTQNNVSTEAEFCTSFEFASDIEVLPVTAQELVGNWYLNQDVSDRGYKLSLSIDGSGSLLTYLNNDYLSTVQIEWWINEDNELVLRDDAQKLAYWQLIKSGNGVFTFVSDMTQLGDDAVIPWVKQGVWSFINIEDKTFSLAELTGAWHSEIRPNDNNFLLYAYTAQISNVRNGQTNGAAYAELNGSRLRISATYNKELNDYDHRCTINDSDCETVLIASYDIIAFDGTRAFLRKYGVDEEADRLFVYKLETGPLSEGFKTHYLNNTKYYQNSNGNIITWRFSVTESGQYFVQIDTNEPRLISSVGSTFQFTYGDEIYEYQLVEADSQGIRLCRLSSGSCAQSDYVRLMYHLPATKVKVNVEEPYRLSVTHNAESGFIEYGDKLSITIHRRETDTYYASSFSGCGIVKPSQVLWDKVIFESGPITKACTFTISASPKPASNADRLGITDPALKTCIDKGGRSEYIEYETIFGCIFENVETSLDGIQKLVSMEQFFLTSYSYYELKINQAAADNLAALENLNYLQIELKGTSADDEPIDIDLSRLNRLENLILNDLPPGSVKLPKSEILKKVDLKSSHITEIDLSGLTGLKKLVIWNSDITSLDLTDNKSLEYIEAGHSEVSSITGVTPEHRIKTVFLNSTPIKFFSLANFTHLEKIYLGDTQLQQLDITGANALKELDIKNSPLTSLRIDEPSAVSVLNISGTQLLELNTEFLPALQYLNAENNMFLSLDLSFQSEFRSLKANTGSIRSIILPDSEPNAYSGLKIELEDNALERLTIPTGLTKSTFNLDGNKLSTLQVLDSPESLSAANNQLRLVSINSSNRDAEINLINNQIEEIALSGTFKSVDLSNNSLTYFEINNSTDISYLNLANNSINNFKKLGQISMSLDLSNNALEALEFPDFNYVYFSLKVNDNPLKELSLLGGGYYDIDVSNTGLETLDLSKVSGLKKLNISNTQIAEFDIPNTLSEFFADSVPMTSFYLTEGLSLSRMYFRNNTLNDITGLDNGGYIGYIHVKNTQVDELLRLKLGVRSHPILIDN